MSSFPHLGTRPVSLCQESLWCPSALVSLSPPAQCLSVTRMVAAKPWTLRSLNLIPVLVGLKLWTASQGVIYPPPSIPQASVAEHSGSIYDRHTGTFQVTDRTNVSFLLRPQRGCSENTTLVLFALSALGHQAQRQALRKSISNKDNVSLIFLVAEARSSQGQLDLLEEHLLHDDLLQVRSE